MSRSWFVVVMFLAFAPRISDAVELRLPVADPSGAQLKRLADGSPWLIGVDHDPVAYPQLGDMKCLTFDGTENFPHCYDQHHGTDFLLAGGFEAMDAGSLDIVAAAEGRVVGLVTDHYDRCHVDAATQDISCDGHPISSNHVALEHTDGMRTEYHHMMKASNTVALGDWVSCGQVLGKIGSSGNSATPHLHLTLLSAAGTWIDPFAGPESQETSYWVQQGGPFGLPGAFCASEALGDLDGDGVSNLEDNCPATPNADQADQDGDGRGDLCEEDPPSIDAEATGEISEAEVVEASGEVVEASGEVQVTPEVIDASSGGPLESAPEITAPWTDGADHAPPDPSVVEDEGGERGARAVVVGCGLGRRGHGWGAIAVLLLLMSARWIRSGDRHEL